MSDVVVVGAGIVGAAVARELAVRGVAVELLDRGAVSSGTTGLGEGNVLCSDKDAGPELELARAGLALYGEIEERLGAEARIRRKGALIVHPDEATWAAEPARLERVAVAGARLVGADELRELEPELTGPVCGASLFPGDLQCDPRAIARALVREAADAGATIREGCAVESVLVAGGDALRAVGAGGRRSEGGGDARAAAGGARRIVGGDTPRVGGAAERRIEDGDAVGGGGAGGRRSDGERGACVRGAGERRSEDGDAVSPGGAGERRSQDGDAVSRGGAGGLRSEGGEEWRLAGGDRPRVAGVIAGGERIDARAVVIAAGPWSAPLAASAGLALPVEPRKGQLVRLAAPRPDLIRHKVVDGSYLGSVMSADAGLQVSTVVETTYDGDVLVGSSRERRGFDASVDPTVSAAMVERAARLFPRLTTLPHAAAWCGFRPWLPDHLPAIGPSRVVPGLWLATGHEGAGVALGPVTGRLIAQLFAGEPPVVDPAPFDPDRFART